MALGSGGLPLSGAGEQSQTGAAETDNFLSNIQPELPLNLLLIPPWPRLGLHFPNTGARMYLHSIKPDLYQRFPLYTLVPFPRSRGMGSSPCEGFVTFSVGPCHWPGDSQPSSSPVGPSPSSISSSEQETFTTALLPAFLHFHLMLIFPLLSAQVHGISLPLCCWAGSHQLLSVTAVTKPLQSSLPHSCLSVSNLLSLIRKEK